MRTRAKLALAFVLLLVAAVPAFAATTPTGKSADEIRAYYDSGDWNRRGQRSRPPRRRRS